MPIKKGHWCKFGWGGASDSATGWRRGKDALERMVGCQSRIVDHQCAPLQLVHIFSPSPTCGSGPHRVPITWLWVLEESSTLGRSGQHTVERHTRDCFWQRAAFYSRLFLVEKASSFLSLLPSSFPSFKNES